MKTILACFAKNESGATAIEYGLIASLIAVVAIAAVTAVDTSAAASCSPRSQKAANDKDRIPCRGPDTCPKALGGSGQRLADRLRRWRRRWRPRRS
jgi:pilus assembly protein Flp/PilA